jgi:cell division protein FtsQ
MDGGRRVLRSLTEHLAAPFAFVLPRPQFAGLAAPPPPAIHPALRSPRVRRSRLGRLHALAVHPIATGALVFGVLGGAFAYGAVHGGAYDQFIQEVGTPGDLMARAVGLGIGTVTISGISELSEGQILAYVGIKARNSLPYLDAVSIRQRLLLVPLVKDVEVRKLYPDRLSIAIVERQPFGLWQKDGRILIISSDGMPIDSLHDEKYANLPLLVGDGANERMDEYRAIMAAAGELSNRIKAATLVSRRRWTLHTTEGVEVRLPETDPTAAVVGLARLQRDQKILDKDIVALDLRVPGRIEVRLSDAAAATRLDASRKAKGKV